MELTKYITITTFCQYHGIESKLLFTFQEMGLLEIVEEESEHYLKEEKLAQLERMVRLYKDLELSPQGVEVVIGLLDKIQDLQEENRSLRRKLGKGGR
jgi:hypothetical protein